MMPNAITDNPALIVAAVRALLMLIAIASYFPYHALVDDLFKALGGFAPPEVLAIITDQLGKIASGQQGGLFTLGMLTTIWSSSAAMRAPAFTRSQMGVVGLNHDVSQGHSVGGRSLMASTPNRVLMAAQCA